MAENNSVICLEQFIQQLTAGGGTVPSPADCVEYGYQRGWLEAQDVLGKESPLLRKSAARILHEYLRRERGESDEADGSPAYKLQDLFDCRVCAGHIIQVYVKGIMDGMKSADGRMIFGAEAQITEEEAKEILDRLFCPGKREFRGKVEKAGEELAEECREPEEISTEIAIKLLQEDKNAVLADVRTVREFEEEHIMGAINIPLLNILKNPYAVSEKRDSVILLYCEEGYQSRAAARCLLEAGYECVRYFARKP